MLPERSWIAWLAPVLHSATYLVRPERSRARRSPQIMGPIGWPELIILLVVVLIIFGPGKLPDIGKAVGKGIKEFRRASNDIEEGLRGEPSKPAPPAAPPANTSTTPTASTPSDKPS